MRQERVIAILIVCFLTTNCIRSLAQDQAKPNIVFILVDQWRAQATGYAGDRNAITPNIDRLASNSINLKNAISGMPVCTPYRASLMTGQYPLTHGVFMNDVMLDTNSVTIARIFRNRGYRTGFIGKWHIDGHGRTTYIPRGRRQGFDYWKALECTHDYNHSAYYTGDSDTRQHWEGYDAIAQTDDATRYIAEQAKERNPFVLFVSMGPPHNPYQSAPPKYREMYENRDIEINKNVPAELHDKVRKDLKGYYAHITAIDDCIGQIWKTVNDSGIGKNTIIVFTADHGDLLGAHGWWNKQQPYAESIRVPFLIHYPHAFGDGAATSDALINTPDIMPTLLGLSNIEIPASVEGEDVSDILKGSKADNTTHTLISCVQPFGQWNRNLGGREFRGIVTKQYTYVKDLSGPWLLFDDKEDPSQLKNLAGNPAYSRIEKSLDKQLRKTLRARKDEFAPGMEYVKKWKYVVDETGTVPYKKINFQGLPIIE